MCSSLTSTPVSRRLSPVMLHLCHASLPARRTTDRKSTRLNSSHSQISYAVFCLKKKKKTTPATLHCIPELYETIATLLVLPLLLLLSYLVQISTTIHSGRVGSTERCIILYVQTV